MKQQRLMRTWYKTDADDESAGTFTSPFPAEAADRRIVAVDWSTPGEVEVTWIVSAP